MELGGLVPLLRRSWALIATCAVVAGVLGFVAAGQARASYEANARVLVGPINADNDTLDAASQLAQTYAELATSESLLEATADKLKTRVGTGRLRSSLTVTADDVTRLITIRAIAGEAGLAADIANQLAEQLTRLVPPGSAPAGEVSLIDRAGMPEDPESKVSLYVGMAAILGALAALASTAAADAASRFVSSSSELTALTGWAVVASIDAPQEVELDAVLAPVSRQAAAYRRVAAFVDQRLRSRSTRFVVVAGAQATDDAHGLALALAATLAADGHRVGLLVPVRSARPSTELDFADLAVETVAFDQVDQVRPAIDRTQARTMMALFDSDIVIVAAPPVNESTGALTWASVADSMLVVVGLGERTEDEVRDAAVALRIAGAIVDGAVAIRTESRRGPRWWRGTKTRSLARAAPRSDEDAVETPVRSGVRPGRRRVRRSRR